MSDSRKTPSLAERAAERLTSGDSSLSAVAADTLIKPKTEPTTAPPDPPQAASPPTPPPATATPKPAPAPASAAAAQAVTPSGASQSATPKPTPTPAQPRPVQAQPGDQLLLDPPGTAQPDALAGATARDGQTPDAFVDMATLEGAGLVVGGPARTRISEEYRIAVSRVLRAARSRRPGPAQGDTIMVTSARPGEGKSFTALNLAGAIAHNVMRPTVLVDVDGKQKSLSYMLGLSERVGLLDIAASGGQRIEDMVVRTAVDHLSILPIGRNASGGDGTARRPISQIIERMARRFPDHIFVLDLPPCLSTSDPSTLAPIVSETIMVVEAEKTQRREVEAALDLIKLCPKITLLLNKLQATTSYTFGAYDYYGSYS